jgi:hypothetical protein
VEFANTLDATVYKLLEVVVLTRQPEHVVVVALKAERVLWLVLTKTR